MRVSIEDVKREPERFFDQVEAGETIVVLREGQPVAEIKPVAPALAAPRPFGLCRGEFTVPDDFDDPLPWDA